MRFALNADRLSTFHDHRENISGTAKPAGGSSGFQTCEELPALQGNDPYSQPDLEPSCWGLLAGDPMCWPPTPDGASKCLWADGSGGFHLQKHERPEEASSLSPSCPAPPISLPLTTFAERSMTIRQENTQETDGAVRLSPAQADSEARRISRGMLLQIRPAGQPVAPTEERPSR